MVRSISELKDIRGKRVLVRLDLNVPIQNGNVEDPYRIERALPTVKYLLDHGARVILMSHMSDKAGSLQPVYAYLKQKIHVAFVDDICGALARTEAGKVQDGTALLLQNIRRDAREEANDAGFAQELASLADLYVNDAFPVSHRAHASVVGITALLPAYAGFQLSSEVEGLSPALTPQSPSLAIVGGAKLVTKVKLIETLLSKYDYVFVGGAIVNDFYRAKGYEVGKSLVSGADHAKPMLANSKIILPDELIVTNPAGAHDTVATEVGLEDVITDISPVAIRKIAPLVAKARTILWNGPMGNFEKGYREGTDELARLIAGSSAKSIVGGGDTLSSIQSLNLMDKFSFVSTAGGAMLDFLANGTLPGIEALKETK